MYEEKTQKFLAFVDKLYVALNYFMVVSAIVVLSFAFIKYSVHFDEAKFVADYIVAHREVDDHVAYYREQVAKDYILPDLREFEENISGNDYSAPVTPLDELYDLSILLEDYSPEENANSESSEDIPSNKEYTQEDVEILARVVMAEAGGCDKDEMARVGQVVLNRIYTDYWEFASCVDIMSTISQENQYESFYAVINGLVTPSQEAYEVAEGLLAGTIDSGLGPDVLFQTGPDPTYSMNVEVVLYTGWHYYSVPTVWYTY